VIPRQFTRDDLRRIHVLRSNVVDLSLAIDDLDRELLPHLIERARLDALLREAQAELATLIRRAA
jgi:uncharacterized protein involved in exopolysaccharide biosynthesis